VLTVNLVVEVVVMFTSMVEPVLTTRLVAGAVVIVSISAAPIGVPPEVVTVLVLNVPSTPDAATEVLMLILPVAKVLLCPEIETINPVTGVTVPVLNVARFVVIGRDRLGVSVPWLNVTAEPEILTKYPVSIPTVPDENVARFPLSARLVLGTRVPALNVAKLVVSGTLKFGTNVPVENVARLVVIARETSPPPAVAFTKML
jgi:hypothetical protein